MLGVRIPPGLPIYVDANTLITRLENQTSLTSFSFRKTFENMKKQNQKRKKKSVRKRDKEPKTIISEAKDDTVQSKGVGKKKTSQAIPKKEKESEKRVVKRDSVFRYVNIAIQFLREAKIELKKVKWPTRKELLASTAMVIFLVLVVSLFLGIIDFGLIKIIKNIVG